MSTQFVLGILTGWLGFLSLAGLIGSLVVDLLVLPGDVPEVTGVRERLRAWRLLSIVALILATAGELVLRAQTMTGGDVASATAALPIVLRRTHFGAIWTTRLIGLGLALLVSFARSRAARRLALLLAASIALTSSLTGHAADWGDLTLSAGIDWLHVLAASAWTGGLISLALVVLLEGRSRPPEFLGVLAGRFSRLAAWCLAAVVLSGSYNSWVQLASVSALWKTRYGQVLGLKILMVLGLVWWGCVNRYAVVPHLVPGRAPGIGARLFRLGRLIFRGPTRITPSAPPARLFTYVRREAMLAVIVFGCTAVLVHVTPGRHAMAGRHHVGAEPGPIRVTMSELHQSGGDPEGLDLNPAGRRR